MTNSMPQDTSDFLTFARAHVQSGGAALSPEELLAQWRAVRSKRDNEDRSALEILSEAGLVGCIETGVGDLSTNKSHMEGFGWN